MFRYHLDLALRSFSRSKALTTLMVLAVALGIGACMTTLTVYHVLSGDPIPAKSDRLFDVELDAAPKVGWQPGQEPTFQLTRFDAEALLRARHARRQVMMSGSYLPVQPVSAAIKPFYASARLTSADFFAMFDAPFRYGSGWDAEADAAQARVVVISKSLNDKVFGGENSVGRELIVRRQAMRVIGVLADWRPVPHYYDLTMGNYANGEEVFVPFATAMALKFGSSGNTECWGNTAGGPRDLNAPCSWVQYWVELASPAEAADFRNYLTQYAEEQRRAGRFERPANVRLRNVMDWLVHREVLPGDVTLQVWLAFGFLLVCLVNTVGLLLAKCLRRSAEIGVRRALGATRGAIFGQFLVEAGTLGTAGGLLGLLLAWGGLWLVRHSPAEYAPLAQMDWPMLALTLALALGASLLAGLLPAWHAARIAPARHLKTL
jgi:putative ABC transport system permease protein